MSKLHELLAVEKGLEKTATTALTEGGKTFRDKGQMFVGSERLYVSREEGGEELPVEHQEMVTTVSDKLQYIMGHVSKWLDAVLQKEATNQDARADIIIGDKILAADVPATFLLGLEAKLKQFRELLASVPTLQSGVKWELDPQRGNNIYSMVHPEEKLRTKKTIMHKVLVEPTEHHPAQIEKWTEDVVIGKFVKHVWTGMLSSAEKSELLGRLDTLERAVKKARQRANSVEVKKTRIGSTINDFLLEGKLSS